MKVDPKSNAGKHLLGEAHGDHKAHDLGADLVDLERTRIIVFNYQFGDAFTLPVPFYGPVVLIRSERLEMEDGQLKDDRSLWLLRHELCHVAQIRQWGTVTYLLKHLWARIRTFSLLAQKAEVEATCYDLHERFRQETFE